MREIKFRGLMPNGQWVYGHAVMASSRDGKRIAIKDTDYNFNNGKVNLIPVSIIPGTEGQFIGKKDSRGVEIYEGDWLQIVDPNGEKMDQPQCVHYDDDHCGYFIEDDYDALPIGYAKKQGYQIWVDGNRHQD